MSAFVIDAFEFCRNNGRREGLTPLADMTRLSKECVDTAGEIAWSLVGSTSAQGFPQILLSVKGTVRLQCQRCMAPMAFEIDSSTLLMLGKDDADADQIEEIIDDESVDVIVGSRQCDIRDLIEDEALLALPQAPKHDVCPDTALLDSVNRDKASPFAGLKALQSKE
ncbi:DUF177 domain-containing protein [Massilia sp. TS11]|uniref:YceD family protein n=1 Tax=Massilia sp. TS11 TaxID=2908003 RepID=UPI001EDB01C4|nr:YceD family protein [Massilia sp. TS11]MCG2583374.1 YceD family protein [Massilia sp. TS11]